MSPVSPDDLRTLIEMGLDEMRDDIPALFNEGERALYWSEGHENRRRLS
jgi:hypothetical protein